MSADARFVAFESVASNLISADNNGVRDIFVRDRQLGTTVCASVDSNGVLGNGACYAPALSADGRYVAFHSEASNLVPGDTNGVADIFVRDLQSGQTERVSVDSGGVQGAYWSFYPAISADGRFVAFESWSNNLVAGDNNWTWDIFVHDRQTQVTERVSVDSLGAEGLGFSVEATISADGRFVAFRSESDSLVPNDTNGFWDIFVHDRQNNETSLVSMDSNGGLADNWSNFPSISADGNLIAFESLATNLAPGDNNLRYDIFVHDRSNGVTSMVSLNSQGTQGISDSREPAISADGRHVAFSSDSSNLVPDDANNTSDVFVYDRHTGLTRRASVDTDGIQGNMGNHSVSISEEGKFVSFDSGSAFVPDDTNGFGDIYLRDRGDGIPSLATSGACPGTMDLWVDGASPHGLLAVIYGQPGSFTNPNPPCQGLVVDLASPTLASLLTADNSGDANLHFFAPSGACGLSVQVVDVAACLTTNVVVLQ
ncbi:MAG: hypothetical protein DWQ01_00835 [Planctomycetota bacterium]|nr:MAG: hypothetical protein DWQ01_00835 [Planctomycetota bacterium]